MAQHEPRSKASAVRTKRLNYGASLVLHAPRYAKGKGIGVPRFCVEAGCPR